MADATKIQEAERALALPVGVNRPKDQVAVASPVLPRHRLQDLPFNNLDCPQSCVHRMAIQVDSQQVR